MMLILEYLEPRDGSTVQRDFHRDEILRGLNNLIHQCLVFHTQTDRGRGMIPTGVGIIFLRSTGKSPGAAGKERIRWLYVQIARCPTSGSPRGRIAGIPILNTEKNFLVGIICPLRPNPAF